MVTRKTKPVLSAAFASSIVLVTAAFVAGCGGGGGGGGDNTPPHSDGSQITAPTGSVNIANVDPVGKGASAALLKTVLGLHGFNPDAPLLAQSYGHTRAAQITARLARRVADKLADHRATTAAGTPLSESESCASGGTVAYSVPAARDSITATLTNCAIESSSSTNGSIAYRGATENPDVGLVIAGVVDASVKVADTVRTVRVEAGFGLSLFCDNDTCSDWTLVVGAGDRDDIIAGTDGLDSWVVSSLQAFIVNAAGEAAGEDRVTSFTFNIASTEIGGSVSVDQNVTRSAFFPLNDYMPSSGEMTALGANATRARLEMIADEDATGPHERVTVGGVSFSESWDGFWY